MTLPAPNSPNDYRVSGSWTETLSLYSLAGGLALCFVGGMGLVDGGTPACLEFKFAYLTAFMFALSIGLGAMFFVLIQHVTGARWSIALRRIAEQLMATLPLLALLMIPILFWLRDLYPWTHIGAADHVLQRKAAYLNQPFFMTRALAYWAIWLALALSLRAMSLRQDRTGDPAVKAAMRRLSAPGLLLFALTITFAAFDWLMSLSPHWYSTIYGVYYFSGSVMGALAMLILLAAVVERSGDAGAAITTEHFHDLGKLLFGFVIFWAYIAFSQLLLIWMANKPEETRWFYDRWNAPGWRAMSWLLVSGHFFLPFLFLLPRTIKRFRPTLVLAALWMLAIHYIDMVYLVMPAFSPGRVSLSPRAPVLALGMLLLLCSFFFRQLGAHPLIPYRDPDLSGSMTYENL